MQTQSKFQSADELIEEFMRTGNTDLLDEGFFSDLFHKGASSAVGFAKRVAGAASGGSRTRQRRIGGNVEMMPGPKLLGPGKEPALLRGHVATSKYAADAHANSRLLPSVSLKTGDGDHPLTSALHGYDYSPVGEYQHPESTHKTTVWMQHSRDRRGNLRDHPDEDGGQFHVHHDTNTGKPTGDWHYFHPPDQHASNSGIGRHGNHNRDRFNSDDFPDAQAHPVSIGLNSLTLPDGVKSVP